MSMPGPSLLPSPTLCLVTDRRFSQGTSLPIQVEAALAGGVNVVQLREKDLAAGELLALAEAIRDVTSKAHALFLLNDRVDVALAVAADGVELGEEAMPVQAVRRIAGRRLLIGRSVHSLDGAREAEAQGADFLVVGTIFPTGSKPGATTAGLELLARVHSAVRIPFLAIGGINAANVAHVMAQGAAGVAVISAILASKDPRQAARELKEAMVAAALREGLPAR
ncbi:MAG: thiamine phosphate synthase [Dehalococcoidia bacterium]|nr:thiamine phosphate synthase [Dehalococcoidia bacterium]